MFVNDIWFNKTRLASHLIYLLMFSSIYLPSFIFAQVPTPSASTPSVSTPSASTSAKRGFRPQINKLITEIKTIFKRDQTKNRLFTIAVMPLKAVDKGAKKADVTQALTELCATRLSKTPGIIQVERARIDSIISELKRSQKGELSPAHAAQAGKLIGATHVLLGTVSTIGADLQISIRLVESETGVILKAASELARRKDLIAFRKDVVLVKSRSGALFRSMLIPGWGQFYNGDVKKGWLFLGASVALIASIGTYALLGTRAKTRYQKNTQEVIPDRRIANDHYNTTNVLLVAAGTLWTAAILDAVFSWRDHEKINLKGWVNNQGNGLVLSGTF